VIRVHIGNSAASANPVLHNQTRLDIVPAAPYTCHRVS